MEKQKQETSWDRIQEEIINAINTKSSKQGAHWKKSVQEEFINALKADIEFIQEVCKKEIFIFGWPTALTHNKFRAPAFYLRLEKIAREVIYKSFPKHEIIFSSSKGRKIKAYEFIDTDYDYYSFASEDNL